MNEYLPYVGGPNRKSRLAKVLKAGRRSALPSLLVQLILTGIAAPRLSAQGLPGVSTTSLTFGSQVAGTTSSAQPITIISRSASGLSVNSITVTGNFTETDTCLQATNIIAMGLSCAILVSYTPPAAGSDSGQLSTAYTAITPTGSTQGSAQVSLSGTGTSSGVSLSPSSLTFGSQELYVPAVVPQTTSTSTAQVVTLTNTGDSSLGIASVVVRAISPSPMIAR